MQKFFIGRFRGIPVYKTSKIEWFSNNTKDVEEIYIFNGYVVYHNNVIANSDSNDHLTNFNEELFEELKEHFLEKSNNSTLEVKDTAETRPQVEESPVNETVEAPDRIVDSFMETWRDNIDNEIAVLKSSIAQMEDDLNAVG